MSRIIYNNWDKGGGHSGKWIFNRFLALHADYDIIEDMLYGEIPDFETVMSAVRELEKEINAL